jgi:rod shape-determining protein MreC
MALSKFWLRNRRPLFVLFLFLAPLVPLVLIKVTLPRIHIAEKISSWVVHPLSEFILGTTNGAQVLWKKYVFLVETHSQNIELKKNIEDLKQQVLSLEQLKTENDRLKNLMNMPDVVQGPRIAAKIVGQDSTSESVSFVLNAGKEHGLLPKMPVVTAEGVVGTVSRVFQGYSTVTAIVDPSHDIDGVILRTRSRFIVEGKARSGLTGRLKYLDRSEDVKVGDEVVTSGIDGVFPKGMLIGHVIYVKRPKFGVSQEAELRTSVDFGKLEEVLVILNPPVMDFTKIEIPEIPKPQKTKTAAAPVTAQQPLPQVSQDFGPQPLVKKGPAQ